MSLCGRPMPEGNPWGLESCEGCANVARKRRERAERAVKPARKLDGEIAAFVDVHDRKQLCAYCGKPTRKGSMVLDEGQTAHRSCYREFENA